MHLTDIDIMFSEATYSTNENGSTVQLMLVLNRPSSTPITVQITDHEVTATSEYPLMLRCYKVNNIAIMSFRG